MTSEQLSTRAIVVRGLHNEGGWAMEDVKVRTIQDNELLVRMVASGICHTDIVFGDNAQDIGGWPRVMGHEGSGYVEKVGSKVTVAQVGDPVLLSYAACLKCQICESGHPSHCTSAGLINFVGNKAFHESSSSDANIQGSFFGQSSFANLSVVNETSVVNAKHLIKSEEELKMFSPLGCGIQTGSGTIYNVAGAKPEDTVAIMGLGGVGLSGIMATKICGCKTIIGIDRVQSRLDLAKELGATHVINTSDVPDLVKAVQDLTEGYGTSITMDTTGLLALIKAGLEFTRIKGQYIQVGTTPPDAKLEIEVFKFMVAGKRFIGAVEGDVIPSEYLPKMIQWYRDGKFPVNRLIEYFKAEDFMKGIKAMESGGTIKPIILW
ncbi:NAD(P)-binding protein [Tothia fuscella]|uniref:NAD(P)-binding protein n=1 Tax=Tothia fuscella TaxID=1048955 RepID=A0A9P4NKY3_9PEZI|nr:NAD(P)-binding protein [Tothia fuscella]